MTLTTTHNRKAYTAGGASAIFAYDFLILASTDLLVYLDGVLQPTANYTVSGVGLGSGGNVTLAAVPAAGVKVVLLRATDPTQQVNLQEGDKLPAEAVELSVFDKVYALAQDLAERVVRAIKIPKTSANATTEMDLPDPALAANFGKALRIKADGTGIEGFTVLSTDIASPITTKGDLIRGSTANTPERLPIGTNAQVLTVATDQAVWATPVTGIPATLLDAKGDLIVATAADTAARKAVGATGAALLADPSTTDGLVWMLGAALHGRVRLRFVSATQISLDPRDGNTLYVKDANGWRLRSIGSAIIAANTSVFVNGTGGQNLADDTTYLVTVFDNAGTLTVDFRSTITHAPDADFGVEIATGQPTRTVVGLIRTRTSFGEFADSDTQRFVRSWFHDPGVAGRANITADRTTASTGAYVHLNTEATVSVVLFASEALAAWVSGECLSSDSAEQPLTGISVDSTTTPEPGVSASNPFNDPGPVAAAIVKTGLAEGLRVVRILVRMTGAATGTWEGTTSPRQVTLFVQTNRKE